jgi:hypothetical protein
MLINSFLNFLVICGCDLNMLRNIFCYPLTELDPIWQGHGPSANSLEMVIDRRNIVVDFLFLFYFRPLTPVSSRT